MLGVRESVSRFKIVLKQQNLTEYFSEYFDFKNL